MQRLQLDAVSIGMRWVRSAVVIIVMVMPGLVAAAGAAVAEPDAVINNPNWEHGITDIPGLKVTWMDICDGPAERGRGQVARYAKQLAKQAKENRQASQVEVSEASCFVPGIQVDSDQLNAETLSRLCSLIAERGIPGVRFRKLPADISAEVFAPLAQSKLQWLLFERCAVDAEVLHYFGDIQTLRAFVIHVPSLKRPEQADPHIARLWQLPELEVASIFIGGARSAACLADVGRARKLHYLHVGGGPSYESDWLLSLAEHARLRSLTLYQFLAISSPSFEALRDLPALEQLTLNHCGFGADAAEVITAMPALTTLSCFNVHAPAAFFTTALAAPALQQCRMVNTSVPPLTTAPTRLPPKLEFWKCAIDEPSRALLAQVGDDIVYRDCTAPDPDDPARKPVPPVPVGADDTF